MTAQNLMNSNPVTLRPTDTVATAANLILQNRLRHLPVVDDRGCYLGTFSIYSLLRLTLPKAVIMEAGLRDVSFTTETIDGLARRLRERGGEPVGNWLNQDDPVMHPDTATMEVMLLMLRGRTTSVPVVDPDSNRLEGMIAFWDVLEKLLEEKR